MDNRAVSLDEDHNLASSAAWACNVYSLVPYLGIAFLPIAFVLSALDYFKARRRRQPREIRLALLSVGLSFLIAGVQIFLWWLLYFIPESRL